jgi:hypothetical protein
MKKIKSIAVVTMAFMLLVAGCKKDEENIDTVYPSIDISVANAFPTQCSVIKKGETFVFSADLSDNVELGSISVDIHHNFDHHSHSTEVEACNMDAKKAAIKPFLLIKDFPIPSGQKNFKISQEIAVPNDIDAGDYHFLIRLTDKSGWQTIKGISVKIQ